MHRKILIFLVIIFLCLPLLSCQQKRAPLPVLSPIGEPTLFQNGGFSFLYPSNWQIMTKQDIEKLWKTELRGEISGFSRRDVLWNGGVFIGNVDPSNYPNSAVVLALIAKVAGIPGIMSEKDFEEAYSKVKSAFQEGLGDRLLSIQKRKIGEFQAIEVEGIGKSRNQILHSVFIFIKADHIYYVSCSGSRNSYDYFVPVFEKVFTSLMVNIEK